MSSDVRSSIGVPKLGHFASGSGTPLVIDLASGVGYYTYKNSVLPLFPNKVDAAHGGLLLSVERAITLGTGWTRIINYDSELLTPPVRMTVDRVAGTIDVAGEGVFQAELSMVLLFNEINAGTSFFVRIVRTSDGAPSVHPFEVFVGRNTAGASVSVTMAFQLAADQGPLAVEIGGGDSYTNVMLRSCRCSITA